MIFKYKTILAYTPLAPGVWPYLNIVLFDELTFIKSMIMKDFLFAFSLSEVWVLQS